MVIGICDDDKTWRRRAKRLLENWFENAGKEAEILCFSQGRELLEYKGGGQRWTCFSWILSWGRKMGSPLPAG